MPKDPIYKHIGERIKVRRRNLELNQENLAKKLGISRGALANIETGRQNILVHSLYKFAIALKMSPFDLLPPLEKGKARRSDLPLPDHLGAEQKKQVAQLFGDK